MSEDSGKVCFPKCSYRFGCFVVSQCLHTGIFFFFFTAFQFSLVEATYLLLYSKPNLLHFRYKATIKQSNFTNCAYRILACSSKSLFNWVTTFTLVVVQDLLRRDILKITKLCIELLIQIFLIFKLKHINSCTFSM